MNESYRHDSEKATVAWARETLDSAVEEILKLDVFDGMLVESRLVWQLPGKVLIGQVRDGEDRNRCSWVISGEVPFDHIDFAVASTPRDAARHFAMKWQLDAARCQDPSFQTTLDGGGSVDWARIGAMYVQGSQILFALIDDEGLWRGPE